ncbi:MAG: FxsA family protein [Rhodobacteraceae bacterium]|nr:MAG: FxsA family protein [Paracoccaceae bacterium]
MYLFVAFLLVPLIEIALFIQVGGLIGLWPTLGIVVLTAIIGARLVRSQGLAALGEVKTSFNDLRDPTEPLAHGALIVFAGALLLTPGFFTDSIGFLLLVPQVRAAVMRRVRSRIHVQQFDIRSSGRPARDDVIDGEWEEVRPNPTRQDKGPSGWTRPGLTED